PRMSAFDPKRTQDWVPIGPRSNSATTRTVNTLPADGLLQAARLCSSTRREDRMGNDRSKDKPFQVGSRDKKEIKRRDLLLSGSSLIAASALTTSMTGSASAELKEYPPGTTFPGRMGRTIGESSPAWPSPVRAKPGSPNVLFIVLDDTGYGQLGCYGSPINTPNINKLARNGLLYTNMHTTTLSSPP